MEKICSRFAFGLQKRNSYHNIPIFYGFGAIGSMGSGMGPVAFGGIRNNGRYIYTKDEMIKNIGATLLNLGQQCGIPEEGIRPSLVKDRIPGPCFVFLSRWDGTSFPLCGRGSKKNKTVNKNGEILFKVCFR